MPGIRFPGQRERWAARRVRWVESERWAERVVVTPAYAMVERAARVPEVRMRAQTEEAGMVVLEVEERAVSVVAPAMVASEQAEPERHGMTS